MKLFQKIPPLIAAWLVIAPTVTAAIRNSANYAIPLEVLDSGGRDASSAAYTSIGSLGGIAGIASASSTQSVFGIIGQIDTRAPELTLPSPIITAATNAGGVAVSFSISAIDDFDPAPVILATPASSSVFPLGDTTVQVSTTDNAGNRSTGNFLVKVLSPVEDNDSDGMNDAAEFILSALGYDWQISQPDLVNTLRNNANVAGLYTQEQYGDSRVAGQTDVIVNPNVYSLYTFPQLQALKPSTRLIGRDPLTSEFTLTLEVAKSTDLSTFSPFPVTSPQLQVNPQGKIELRFTSPDNAAFFRVEAD